MMFDISGVDDDAVEEFLSALYESFEDMEHELTVLDLKHVGDLLLPLVVVLLVSQNLIPVLAVVLLAVRLFLHTHICL